MEPLIDRLLEPIARVVLAVESALSDAARGKFEPATSLAARLTGLATPKRLRAWSVFFLAGYWLPLIAVPYRSFWDFAEFYAAGRLVGTSALMDVTSLVALELGLGLQSVPFVYTPAFAWLYAPLSGLPVALAGSVNLVVMFALLGAAVELGRRVVGLSRPVALVGALAWPPAAIAVITGQTSTLGLFLAVVACLCLLRGGRWDILAGLAVAGLAYKPTLALPLLGLLLLRCRWRALVAAAVGLGALYLLSVAATGGDWNWVGQWLSAANYVVSIDTANQWQAVSIVETLGGHPAAYVLAAALVVALLPGLRARPLPEAVALAMVAGLVVSPHALVYDATLVLPAVALLGRRAIPLYILAAMLPLGVAIGFQPLTLGLVVWLLGETRLAGRRDEWSGAGTAAAPLSDPAPAR